MNPPDAWMHEFGRFRIDYANKRLMRGDDVIPLSPKVFDTLQLLVENAPRLVEKDEFLRRLWPKVVVEESALAENISRLRRALGDSESQPFIETQPKRGYRFVAPVTRVPAAQAGPGLPAPPRRRRTWIAMAATAVALAGAAAWFLLHAGSGPAAPVRSIAVLPFVNLSGDREQEYFTDGMTDELITELAQFRALRVISRSSVMRYKGTDKSLQQIGRELNVDALVEGTVSRSAGQLRVSAQVIRVAPEEHLWAEHFERKPDDLVALEVQLAREIADGIRVQLSPGERTGLAARRNVSPAAHEAFLKGRFYWGRRTEAGTRRAIEYFQAAIDADPDYALAYSGLADSFVTLALPEALQEVLSPDTAYPLARDAAQRAIAIDDSLGEAHATLAHIKFQYERDWAGAEHEFRRAIALSPNYANAHQWYALEQFWAGHVDEALRQARLAHELDPLSLVVNANECFILAGAGQFDRAIAQCQRTLELDPDFVLAHYRFGQLYLLKGEYSLAVPELQRAVQLSGDCPRAVAELALALVLAGDSARARQLLDSMRASAARRPVSQFDFAVVLAALGERDAALTALERAFDEHAPSLSLLNWSPAFTSLRGEPRFVDLVRRIGLPAR